MIDPTSKEAIKLLTEWDNAATQLAKWKELELNLRLQVANSISDEHNIGTENFQLKGNYTLKIVKPLNYNLDKNKVNDVLDEIEQLGGNEGKLIADRLVKFKPELSLTEYNQLPSKYKPLIDSIIMTSKCIPRIEIIAPKKKML